MDRDKKKLQRLRYKMSEFLRKITMGTGFLILVLFGFGWDTPQAEVSRTPHPGGTLRIKDFNTAFSPELDPALARNIFVTEQLFDGLVRFDKSFNIVPDLAEYWVISEEGKLCTFYLRKGVHFHHGRELTAGDVKFSLERLIQKSTQSPYFQFFTPKVAGAQEFRDGKAAEVSGFRVRDRYIFEIQWNEAYVSGLYLMSMSFCKILPRELVEGQGKKFFVKPSGTGPFKFAYWLRSPSLDIVGVRLEKNTGYFDKKPHLEAIEYSPHYTVDNFVNGEIDIIPFLSGRVARLGTQVMSDGSFDLFFLGLSCHLPPLDRREIREALALALNKQNLSRAVETVDSLSPVTNNYVPAKLPGFFPLDDRFGYDPQRAKKILDDQGFSSRKPFPPLAFFVLPPNTEFKTKLYKELRDELSTLGISLRLEYYKSVEELKKFREPYLVLMGWIMDFPDPENVIRPLFSSKAVFNLFGYSNAQLDGLLARAEVEQSWTRRIELFQQIQQMLSEDLPAIPLFSRDSRIAVQPWVRGMTVPPLGFYYLNAKDIWLDK